MSILDRIRSNGGEVIRHDYKIVIRRGKLSDTAMNWIKERKADLIREVWPEYDEWEERAAIREYCGGQDRSTAEVDAYQEVMAR